MIIEVDTASLVPPYEQVREQITTMVASGVLPAGTRLPTIRQLAADLDLAPGTITRAYRELEHAGLVTTRGRHGTFTSSGPRLSGRERKRRLRAEADRLARMARQLGATPDEALDELRRALRA